MKGGQGLGVWGKAAAKRRSHLWFLLALSACGGKHGPDVALLLAHPQTDAHVFEEHAKDLGLTPLVLAADDDRARQIAQVEHVLTLGAKVVVVQPTDGMAAASYVLLAHEHGAKIVAYDRAIVAANVDCTCQGALGRPLAVQAAEVAKRYLDGAAIDADELPACKSPLAEVP